MRTTGLSRKLTESRYKDTEEILKRAGCWLASGLLFSVCVTCSFILSLSRSCFCCPLCRSHSGPMTFKVCSSSSSSTSRKSHSGAEKPGVSLLLCWFSSLMCSLCLQSGCCRSSSYILSALGPVEGKLPAPDDFTLVLGVLRAPEGNHCRSTETLLGATHTNSSSRMSRRT